MKRMFFVFVTAVMVTLTSRAVVYETHAYQTPKVYAYHFTVNKESPKTAKYPSLILADSIPVELENGMLVNTIDTIVYSGTIPTDEYSFMVTSFAGQDQIRLAIIEHEGRQYAVEAQDLVFRADQNPDDTTSYLARYEKTSNQRFWHTWTPFVIIFLLLVAATLFTWIATKVQKHMAAKLLTATAVLTLCVVAIEMQGIFSVGSDIFWWLGMSRWGVWTCCGRLIPLVLAAAMQLGGISLFSRAITRAFGNPDEPLTIKPIIKAICYTLLGLIVVIFFEAQFISSEVLEAILCLVALAVIGYFIYRQSVTYRQALGNTMGTLFTVYAAVWAVCSVVAIIFYGMGILKVIVPLLIVIAIIVIAGATMSVPLGGITKVGGLFRARDGSTYTNEYSARKANLDMGNKK